MLNMHLDPGVWFTLPEKRLYLFQKYEEDYLRKLQLFRQACEKAIGTANIKICVENCNQFADKPFLVKGLACLLESPAFKITLDVGHSASGNYADEVVLQNYLDDLYHMHLHDAKGKSDHLTLGEGEVNLKHYLTLASQHQCRVVIEVKTIAGLRASQQWLKEHNP